MHLGQVSSAAGTYCACSALLAIVLAKHHLWIIELKPSIEIIAEEEGVALKISNLDKDGIQSARKRLEQIVWQISTIMEFDECLESLAEDEFNSRIRGCMALDLKYQSSLALAKSNAQSCLSVARGDEDIYNYGFPELSGGDL